jgi:hypothetical protein
MLRAEDLGHKERKGCAKFAMAPEEDIGRAVIGAAIKIHSIVGPGLLE